MAQLSSGLLRRSAVNVVERRARRIRYAQLGRLVLVIVGTRVSVTIVAGRRVGHGLSRPLRCRCTVNARIQFVALIGPRADDSTSHPLGKRAAQDRVPLVRGSSHRSVRGTEQHQLFLK